MKKISIILAVCFVFIFFAGCTSSVDLTEHLKVEFSGLNGEGEASGRLDASLIAEISESKPLNEKDLSELLSLSYDVLFDKDSDLSNGDTIEATMVVSDKDSRFKGGKKTFVVEGLQDAVVITTEELEKNLVVNFTGASGNGMAQIENLLKYPLSSLNFELDNNEKLKNGDMVRVKSSEKNEYILNQYKYKLENDGMVEFEVAGLHEVAARAEGISNLGDIERMIQEDVLSQYRPDGAFTKYSVTLENFYYRAFSDREYMDGDIAGAYFSTEHQDAILVGIFKIENISSANTDAFYLVQGYKDLFIDQAGAGVTNITKATEISEIYRGKSYETMLQYVQGFDLEQCENKLEETLGE